jgi:long-chain acyl-CoA synthetase
MELDLELYRRDVPVSDEPRVRLSAIDIEPGEAEQTIVFLHGFGGRATQWKHQLKFFCEDNRVVALDWRGHGASDRPDSEYTMDELLGDLKRALEELAVPNKFVLAAHSFGGAVAISYAVQHPERIEKLVLVSVSNDFRLSPLIRFTFRLPTTWLEPIRSLVRRQLSAPAYVLKKFYHATLSTWNSKALLPKVTVPTLTVMGHRDIVFPQASYQAVAEGIPNAQSVIIPVSAHLVQLERPDAVNRAIQRFLEPVPLSWRERGPKVQLTRDRPWLKHYEMGVPLVISLPSQPLHRFLESAARRHPRKTALIFFGRKMTYRELDDLANRFAIALRKLGVEKGDRVMILLPNMPQCVIAYYSALKAGAVVVLSNPLSGEGELAHQVSDSGAETIVTMSRFYDAVKRVRDSSGLKHVIVTNIKEYFPLYQHLLFTLFKEKEEGHRIEVSGEPNVHWFQDLLKMQPGLRLNVEVSPSNLALIQYTGGTTAVPKGTMLTHRNLVANAIQIRHWITDAQEGKEILLGVLPFSHSYGMTVCMNLAICLASAIVLLPTFVTKDVLKAIYKYKPTFFPGVPTMYTAINDYPGVRRYRVSSIRACISGAAPLPIEVQEAFEKLTKGKLVEGYGLTEASPVTHANPLQGLRKAGFIGVPVPGTEAKIIDLETGEDLPPGEIGELAVRGPQVMAGYWNMPKETAQVIQDGWLRTGDVARMDEDGYLQIIDRKKDMIIAGEYNVYPRDVEEVLYEHPKVLEAAVVGIPYEHREQAVRAFVKAFIVLKHGEEATEEEIRRLCEERLDEYKIPQRIEFRAELPKSMVGKVLRRMLAEEEEKKRDRER